MTRHDHKINNSLQDETMTPAQPSTLPPTSKNMGPDSARRTLEK